MASYVGGTLFGTDEAGWLGTISDHPLNIFVRGGGAQVTFKKDFGMDLKGTRPYIQWFDGSSASGYILPPDNFIRIHNSYIINKDFLEKYIRGEGGQVIMSNGVMLDVSKRKKHEFLKAIGY